jgi:hypothetical protein
MSNRLNILPLVLLLVKAAEVANLVGAGSDCAVPIEGLIVNHLSHTHLARDPDIIIIL